MDETAASILHVTTGSPVETATLGERLGRCFIGGLCVGLVGPLGAGKTQLVKGIATGNGLANDRGVTSPTFTLVQEYPGRLLLYHIDVYRLRQPAELDALGFAEMSRPDTAVVIEWADRVERLMPDDALWVQFELLGESQRSITIRATGPQSHRCLNVLRNSIN